MKRTFTMRIVTLKSLYNSMCDCETRLETCCDKADNSLTVKSCFCEGGKKKTDMQRLQGVKSRYDARTLQNFQT